MAPRTLISWWTPEDWQFVCLPDQAAVEEHVVAQLLIRAGRGLMAKTTLASGNTFAGVFRRLRALVDAGAISFEGVSFHHLDEFEGVEPGAPGSLSGEIASGLFPDEDERRGWFYPVEAGEGEDAAVAAHEKNIAGSQLLLLGLGANGHIAFNGPGTPFASRSHVATLAPGTRAAHASRFRGAVPDRALTAGIQTILSANDIIVVATGASKAAAVVEAIAGPLSPDCPASALRMHDRVTWVLDREAAAGLDGLEGVVRSNSLVILERGSPEPEGATLVVAPHPDDASISCGGLLASVAERSKKHIVTFSTGARAVAGMSADEARAVREHESQEEARILGASVSFLRARAYDTGVFEPDDARALLAILEQVQPSRILLPSRNDPHPTHRLCRLTVEEAVRAWFEARPRTIDLWTYEGPWCQLAPDIINVIVKLDQAAHERKQSGIRAHESQIERVPFHVGADALERLRAISFSEAHLGGKSHRGFDHATRVECYRRLVVGPDQGSVG